MEKPVAISQASPARGVTRAASRPIASARYYVCLGILVLAAVSMQAIADRLGSYFRKLPVPLRKVLHEIDKAKLAPEYEPAPIQPPPIDSDTLANLGTEEYLQWNLLDRRESADSAVRQARVFITYYTGQPDMVPHNPEECMGAAGWTKQSNTVVDVNVTRIDGKNVTVPVRIIEFEAPQRASTIGPSAVRMTVLFFFYANGIFETTRSGVRAATQRLTDRYSFYSKVEISFSDEGGRRPADREAAVKAIPPLLQKLMPILLQDHYPDWDAISHADSAAEASKPKSGELGTNG